MIKSQQEADALKRKQVENELQHRLDILKSQMSSSTMVEQDLNSTQLDMTLFPLNGDPVSPSIHTIESVVKAYRRMLKHSEPSYPTYFQHILQKGIE